MEVVAMEELLRAHGCTLTAQRRALLRHLHGNVDHPSAGEIFDAVTRDFPITSRATVYNTLALLEEVGAVRTVCGHAGETRYDPNLAPHHHLICTVCGRLEDVPAESVVLLRDGRPAEGEVRFSGRCTRCG
jgi:Fe2+ or Zn2+ uptake regulation protein